MAKKPPNKPNVVSLPVAVYRTDIPTSLRNLADWYENGNYPMPTSLAIVTESAEGVSFYTQGLNADDNLRTLGMLEMAKSIVISCTSMTEDNVDG